MLKRATILFMILTLLPVLMFAQNKALLKPGGRAVYLSKDQDAKEVFKVMTSEKKAKFVIKSTKNQYTPPVANNVNGTPDTLSHQGVNYSSTFGGFGQDVLVGWFVCPSDLIIKAVGFDCGDNPGAVDGEITLYKIGNGWDLEKLQTPGALQLGWWVATGNGFNDITPFEKFASEPKTWVPATEGATYPFAEDIWSDEGVGAPVKPEYDNNTETYQWVEMNLLQEPTLLKGEIFAIAIKNVDQVFDANRFGIMSDVDLGYGMFKFYANGRTSGNLATAGWWQREYMPNFVAAVELTGDIAPKIEDITDLGTTMSTSDRVVQATITDVNPSGGPAGVASATLQYFLNEDSVWIDVPMTAAADVYSGTIPGQTAPTQVTYRVKATDVAGFETISEQTFWYKIFAASGAPSLIVFNGFSGDAGYPQDYYFAEPFKSDVWSFGPLTAELLNNYTNVIEIATSGPNDINSDEVKTWIGASPTHNYMLIGDEWLGSQSNWTNSTYAAGTFQYDILGVVADSNDVNYDASGDEQGTSLIYPQQGTLLGDSLYNALAAATEDSLLYNPYYEISVSNWLDGVFVQSDVVVDYKAKGVSSGEMFNVGIHRTLPAGNKIVFLTFDPLSLDANPPYTNDNYVWYGYSTIAPQFQAVTQFFNVATDVSDDISKANQFKLSQNYPNPFNPTTNIRYTIPQSNNVTIVVFDMLGKEVAKIVNGFQQAGTHTASFNASNLSSGLYIYKLTAGEYSTSKKMMLLK